MNPKTAHLLGLLSQIANGAQLLANTYFGTNAATTVIVTGVGVLISTVIHALATVSTPAAPTAPTPPAK